MPEFDKKLRGFMPKERREVVHYTDPVIEAILFCHDPQFNQDDDDSARPPYTGPRWRLFRIGRTDTAWDETFFVNANRPEIERRQIRWNCSTYIAPEDIEPLLDALIINYSSNLESTQKYAWHGEKTEGEIRSPYRTTFLAQTNDLFGSEFEFKYMGIAINEEPKEPAYKLIDNPMTEDERLAVRKQHAVIFERTQAGWTAHIGDGRGHILNIPIQLPFQQGRLNSIKLNEEIDDRSLVSELKGMLGNPQIDELLGYITLLYTNPNTIEEVMINFHLKKNSRSQAPAQSDILEEMRQQLVMDAITLRAEQKIFREMRRLDLSPLPDWDRYEVYPTRANYIAYQDELQRAAAGAAGAGADADTAEANGANAATGTALAP